MTEISKMKIKMKILLSFTGMILFALIGCTEPEGYKAPEDPLDAGREFIRAVMDGDYEEAELYLSEDEEDKELFSRYKQYMKKQPQKERLSLKSASIIINKMENQGDSVCLINFSNSHSMKPMDLKVINEKNGWKIDFSYTFSGNLPLQD
jgi:hypothetical protein